jgi:hypothetical protein
MLNFCIVNWGNAFIMRDNRWQFCMPSIKKCLNFDILLF